MSGPDPVPETGFGKGTQQRFLEDRYGSLWLVANDDALIEWAPRSPNYIERTRGPLTEWRPGD